LILNPTERAETERHAKEIDALCARTPAASDDWAAATLIVITKLMLALPGANQSEVGVEATGEAFQAALDDVPTWAVAAAVRRWYRGACDRDERGEPYNYHWRPAPAELRRIALVEKWRVQCRAHVLRKLLSAEPLIEFNDEHRAAMRARLTHHIGFTPAVGKDGSARAIGRQSVECATVGPDQSANPA
jgi:hypothetical protein